MFTKEELQKMYREVQDIRNQIATELDVTSRSESIDFNDLIALDVQFQRAKREIEVMYYKKYNKEIWE